MIRLTSVLKSLWMSWQVLISRCSICYSSLLLLMTNTMTPAQVFSQSIARCSPQHMPSLPQLPELYFNVTVSLLTRTCVVHLFPRHSRDCNTASWWKPDQYCVAHWIMAWTCCCVQWLCTVSRMALNLMTCSLLAWIVLYPGFSCYKTNYWFIQIQALKFFR